MGVNQDRNPWYHSDLGKIIEEIWKLLGICWNEAVTPKISVEKYFIPILFSCPALSYPILIVIKQDELEYACMQYVEFFPQRNAKFYLTWIQSTDYWYVCYSRVSPAYYHLEIISNNPIKICDVLAFASSLSTLLVIPSISYATSLSSTKSAP